MSAEKIESPSGREAPDHGPTVDPVTRELRRTSVSQLQSADESTNEGCLRKWWYERIMGRKEPSTAAQEDGKLHHSYMDHYLTTGDTRLPDRIVRNLHFVPKPGADLLVEHPTIPKMSDGSSGLAHAPLRAAGVPVVGYIDCVDGRLENPGTRDITDTRDPPGTIHVRDWKFTGSLEFAKSGPDLVKTIQMAGYGKYRFDVGWPGDLVRLSHGYFPKKGRGELRSIRVDREAIERSWEHAASVTRSLRDVARENDAEKVPANRRACRAFNKQCMHAADGYCTAGMHNSLRQIVGARASQALTTEDIMGVSILDRIRGTGTQTPTPINIAAAPSTPTVTVALTGVPAPGPTPEQIAATKAAAVAKLAAEEQEQRAAKQFDALISRVQEHTLGMPAFAGRALELYRIARPAAPADAFTGSGQIGAPDPVTGEVFTVEDPATLAELVAELDALAVKHVEDAKNVPAPVAGGLLPPESPMPIAAPAPAAVPTAPAATIAAAQAAAAEPAKAPRKPRGAAQAATSVTASIAVDAQERLASPPSATVAERTEAMTAARSITVDASDRAQDGQFGGKVINLIVDCTVEGVIAASLHGLVQDWCDTLARNYDAADIRCAPEKSPLGFGKWPGALHAFVAETAAQLAPGWYSLDSHGGQVIEVVIEALRPVIRASGGALIRGHR